MSESKSDKRKNDCQKVDLFENTLNIQADREKEEKKEIKEEEKKEEEIDIEERGSVKRKHESDGTDLVIEGLDDKVSINKSNIEKYNRTKNR